MYPQQQVMDDTLTWKGPDSEQPAVMSGSGFTGHSLLAPRYGL